MGIYENNLEALEKSTPDIFERLKNSAISDCDNVKVIKSPFGHNVMYLKNSNGYFAQMNSMYNPYEEAAFICRNIKKDFLRRLVVVIGVGMGFHIREIVEKLNEKSVAVVIESDINVLISCLRHEDLSREIKTNKLLFICGDIEEIKKELWGLIQSATYNLKDINIVTLPVADLQYIRFCSEIVGVIEKSRINHIFNMGNDTEDTLIGIRNNFMNMHEMLWNCGIAEFLTLYRDEYKDKPAVVVASGPSLSKNIHLLRDVQNKALILACDGAMKPLLENGIVPDAVLSVERIMLTYEWFYKDKEIPENTVLIAPPVVRPEIFDKFAGNRKIIGFKKGEGVNEWISKAVSNKGKISAGSSVAHLCFNFAELVGADPIILIGQDLAYSPDGYTHGKGVEGGKKVDLSKGNIVYVKDYDGRDIPTTEVWRNFLTQLEVYIRNSKAKCIDATEGGARKEGSEIMKFKDVIDLYFKEDLPPLYTIVEKYRSDEKQVIESYSNLVKLVKKEQRWFELLRARIKKLEEQVEDIVGNFEMYKTTDEGVDKIFDTVMLVENKLAKKLERRYMFLMMFQTALRDIAFEVSDLGLNVKKLTPDVLLENIRIQQKLMKIVDVISGETLKTLEEVLKITEDDLNRLQ